MVLFVTGMSCARNMNVFNQKSGDASVMIWVTLSFYGLPEIVFTSGNKKALH